MFMAGRNGTAKKSWVSHPPYLGVKRLVTYCLAIYLSSTAGRGTGRGARGHEGPGRGRDGASSALRV